MRAARTSARARTFGGKVIECTTMFANLRWGASSVKRMAPFGMATLDWYQHVRARQPTHGLAIQMSLSGEDDYVSIYVIIIIFEASYR
jgi:hypothetical protein